MRKIKTLRKIKNPPMISKNKTKTKKLKTLT
jgi:hypothetical protein